MALVTDQNNLFNLVQSVAWTGRYSGSQGTQDFSNVLTFETTYVPTVQTEVLNSTELVTTGFNTYYKMQGFNSSSGRYEVWFSMGEPLFKPPSGNSLTNIAIVLAWVDR